jgi:hypothetical protein
MDTTKALYMCSSVFLCLIIEDETCLAWIAVTLECANGREVTTQAWTSLCPRTRQFFHPQSLARNGALKVQQQLQVGGPRATNARVNHRVKLEPRSRSLEFACGTRDTPASAIPGLGRSGSGTTWFCLYHLQFLHRVGPITTTHVKGREPNHAKHD